MAATSLQDDRAYASTLNPATVPASCGRAQSRISNTIASYPNRSAWRHTFWWREGTINFADAQFFASISQDHPVLSVGVSVEKGFEKAMPTRPADEVLDREVWAWQRLVRQLPVLLDVDMPQCAVLTSRPIMVRFYAYHYVAGRSTTSERRCFVFHQGSWFERHAGTANPPVIAEYVNALDGREDWWVDTYFGCDYGPDDVKGMSPDEFADLLMNFQAIRQRLASNND